MICAWWLLQVEGLGLCFHPVAAAGCCASCAKAEPAAIDSVHSLFFSKKPKKAKKSNHVRVMESYQSSVRSRWLGEQTEVRGSISGNDAARRRATLGDGDNKLKPQDWKRYTLERFPQQSPFRTQTDEANEEAQRKAKFELEEAYTELNNAKQRVTAELAALPEDLVAIDANKFNGRDDLSSKIPPPYREYGEPDYRDYATC